ncbi:hypothetical protein BOVATA_025920 [Babesia ovata]|uniref:BRCT domain-containing protein n=1 Tax=Babesia ovata TaxID=189622 RepID=A0A2H6KDR7_9APIC|nr:uncharacterized protein BOVATA_025920 [Babesia ovata]GBE61099.1 hypothetical protein BOVATA_025920 [Babesia ovata]
MATDWGASQAYDADLPRQCRHIEYIEANLLKKVLMLEQMEVVNASNHRCFIPTCQGGDLNDLKVFFNMGTPPMNTYHPINYIGIGLHYDDTVDTSGWYTAYVPLHLKCFNNDLYALKHTLIRLIGSGKFWLPRDKHTDRATQGSQNDSSSSAPELPSGAAGAHSAVGMDGPQYHAQQGIKNTQDDATIDSKTSTQATSDDISSPVVNLFDTTDIDIGGDDTNVFMPACTPLGVTDPNRYIFVTPSCMYATLPELASVLTFEGLQVSLRMVIQVVVKPRSYIAAGASVQNLKNNFDCCFPNDAIEWYVDDVENVIPQRLLARILRKEEGVVRHESCDSPIKPPQEITAPQVHGVNLITVMPSTNVLFACENNFLAMRGAYSSVGGTEDAVTFLDATSPKANTASVSGSTTPIRATSSVQKVQDTAKQGDPSPKRAATAGNTGDGSTEHGAPLLALKLKWTEHNNRVVYYLKSIIGSKFLEWDSELKIWRINAAFLYECVKYAIFLGLRVCDRVLYALWSWLRSIDMRAIGDVFSKVHLIDWLGTNKIWQFQRVSVRVTPGFNPAVHRDTDNGATPAVQAMSRENAETVEIKLLPFNKDIVTKFKERNAATGSSSTYVWDKESGSWLTGRLLSALEDLLAVLPHLRESNLGDTFLSSRGINLRDINREQKKRQFPGQISVPLKRPNATPGDDSDSESEFATVTKLLITAAGKEPHLMRIRDKIRRVVENVAPPTSSISASGKVISGGAGTGGIEFVEAPRGCEWWNKVSLCVVPDEQDGEIPVDPYDPQLLASLIGEVYLVKEGALDYLLANFKRWPGPHDAVGYSRWTSVMTRHEPNCWGGLTFDGRQNLAQSRLFCDEDFFVSGTNENRDAALCRLLIQLGSGKIVTSARDAEYVIITDRTSQEALELQRQFGANDEDLIAKTHGARHSTLVTPKFIYDCILGWRLQRPTRSHGHMAF